MQLSLNNISFTHNGAIHPLFRQVSLTFPTGWTGIVGANGTGKTTLLRLVCGELEPDCGSVHSPGSAVYCRQRTNDPPLELQEFLQSPDSAACEIKGTLKIKADWHARWNTLSHGERKRAQIAVALWLRPDVIALDEPTNHLDADARSLLMRALKNFNGIGLLVSHDRELLDGLCRQCVFVDPPAAAMRPGNYADASCQARLDDMHIQDEYERVKADIERLHKEAVRRKEKASQAKSRRSKRKLAPGDSDGRAKINGAIVSGADGNAGRLSSRMEARVRRAESRLDEFDMKRRYETSFWLPGSKSPRNVLFSLAAGSVELGDGRRLHFPELAMTPEVRIAVTGRNGTGKSTLIRHIVSLLTLPEEKIIYIPQEIDEAQSRRIMQDINSLSRERLGTIMTLVRCLGSAPQRLVGSTESSPGEIRKVMLALGVSNRPHLIIMDEPTNHLDLPAIECLESALAGCPCGLLLVSHDLRFLSRLASSEWRLAPDGDGDVQLSRVDTFDTR